MRTTESEEMYLESILLLKEKQSKVRSVDVSHHTGYSKPSVSRAMGILKKHGHIEIDSIGYITLTESGNAVACKILERHRILTQFLIGLGVDQETASEDACRIEHVISEQTFNRIKNYAVDRKKD